MNEISMMRSDGSDESFCDLHCRHSSFNPSHWDDELPRLSVRYLSQSKK